jgi:hypothetical protein
VATPPRPGSERTKDDRKRRRIMGDKGKKDKDKGQKQKAKKHDEEASRKREKQPKRAPSK